VKQLIDEKNWDALKEHFQKFVNKVMSK